MVEVKEDEATSEEGLRVVERIKGRSGKARRALREQ